MVVVCLSYRKAQNSVLNIASTVCQPEDANARRVFFIACV